MHRTTGFIFHSNLKHSFAHSQWPFATMACEGRKRLSRRATDSTSNLEEVLSPRRHQVKEAEGGLAVHVCARTQQHVAGVVILLTMPQRVVGVVVQLNMSHWAANMSSHAAGAAGEGSPKQSSKSSPSGPSSSLSDESLPSSSSDESP